MRIGPFQLKNNLIVAPMAGVTDRPFRQLCKKMGAGMAVSEMVGSRHPHESHFYLFLLGAAEQGQGIGAALIAPVLARCDADRLPAYLESSSDRNMSFYERLGFRVTWAERPTADGPLLRGMWRDPA